MATKVALSALTILGLLYLLTGCDKAPASVAGPEPNHLDQYYGTYVGGLDVRFPTTVNGAPLDYEAVTIILGPGGVTWNGNTVTWTVEESNLVMHPTVFGKPAVATAILSVVALNGSVEIPELQGSGYFSTYPVQ